MPTRKNPLNCRNTKKLIFPSGRSVERAKADAKALAKLKSIPLYEAQDQIAKTNGLFMSWKDALKQLKSTNTKSINKFSTDELLNELIKKLDSYNNSRLGFGEVFHLNAVSLVVHLVPALRDLARSTNESVDMDMIIKYVDYKQYCLLLNSTSISEESRQILMEHISTRPGYDAAKLTGKQYEVIRLFVFARSYILRAIPSVAQSNVVFEYAQHGTTEIKNIPAKFTGEGLDMDKVVSNMAQALINGGVGDYEECP